MRASGKNVRPEQIYDKVKCRICREIIAGGEEYVITSDFFKPDEPLWPFANVAMHSRCFLSWEKRAEFLLPRDIVIEHRLTPDLVPVIFLRRKE